MSTLDDKPLLVIMWLGDVDRQVAIAHLHADGAISSADLERAKKSIRLTENCYSKAADGSPGFGKIEPLAAFLGTDVTYHGLSDHDGETTDYFREWLNRRGYTVVIHTVPLHSATDYAEVYGKVDALLNDCEKTHPQFLWGLRLLPCAGYASDGIRMAFARANPIQRQRLSLGHEGSEALARRARGRRRCQDTGERSCQLKSNSQLWASSNWHAVETNGRMPRRCPPRRWRERAANLDLRNPQIGTFFHPIGGETDGVGET
jgi:hypothetical protein